MKDYERVTKHALTPRMPTIIRVDGKAFHTFTKRLNKDVDPSCATGPSEKMHAVMARTTRAMCNQMQNVALAYTQSDEISFLLRDYDKLETQQWFGGKIQKIASVSAGMASAYFNFFWNDEMETEPAGLKDVALFDARVFQIPKEDVTNYFVWRQKDAVRNSINFIARLYFSHKELHKRDIKNVQEMLWQVHHINWNDFDVWKRRGSCIVPNDVPSGWVEDDNTPIFTKKREYIDSKVYVDE